MIAFPSLWLRLALVCGVFFSCTGWAACCRREGENRDTVEDARAACVVRFGDGCGGVEGGWTGNEVPAARWVGRACGIGSGCM
ncbi:hypothetical protein OF83DRAFT_748884 [Amylostereum chailletii]|nr:hypothetical protein OF83DRAFT_748884 [Amylostereum chailletii]